MEFLKELLGEELFKQIESKINEHNGNEANKDKQIKLANLGSGEYVGKGKHDSEIERLNTLLSGKETDIATLTKTLEDLKKSNGDAETTKKKLEDAEAALAASKDREAETLKKYALRDALRDAKAVDIGYLTYVVNEKLAEQGKTLELDENDNIKGWDEIISGLKTQHPTQFESVNGDKDIDEFRLPPPNNNGGTVTKEQFDKMGYQSRLKLKQEQPEIYAQMTGKATE